MNFWPQSPVAPPPPSSVALTWEQAWYPLLYVTTTLLAVVVAYKFIWEVIKVVVACLTVIGALTVWARWKALVAAVSAAVAWVADHLATADILQEHTGQQQENSIWRVLFK